MRLNWCAAPLAIGLGLTASTFAAAQGTGAPPPVEPEKRDPNQIVVTGGVYGGAVIAPQPPIATLDETQIASYGASNVSDLIDALSAQTGSGRGRGGHPVILVNGMRISSFRELRNYPPEAIAKVEVFPEEVALRYGYPPDQRVVNLILKRNYSSKSAEIEYRQPQRGGTSRIKGEGSVLKLAERSRFNLALNADHTSPLTEAERRVIQQPGSQPTVAGDPDPATARTLVSRGSNTGANLTYTAPVGEGVAGGTLTMNAAAARAQSTSLQGLASVALTAPAPGGATALRTLGAPLARIGRTDTVQAGAALNKPVGAWQLSATIDGTHATSHTDTALRPDTSGLVMAAAVGTLPIDATLPLLAAPGFARATNTADSLSSLATLIGHPLHLPAGNLNLTLKPGFAYTHSVSRDSRALAAPVDLRRGDASAGFNLSLPIASRREHALEGIGDLTLNLSAGVDHLSDFGTLTDWSAGLNWGVTEKLDLSVSYIVNQAAPSLSQLGAPVVQNFNVPVFDFTRGQSVLVTTTSGGNPALARQTQRDFKLGLEWQLPFVSNGNLVVEYFSNNSRNVSSDFPLLTPVSEAAFPTRVTRDAPQNQMAGRLVAIDVRPVTFAQQKQARLRYGLTISGKLGKPLPQTDGPRGPMGRLMGMMGGGGGGGPRGGMGGPPPGGGREGGGRGGFGGGMGGGAPGQGRWNLAFYHTVQFIDRVTLVPGGQALDLLGGDALSSGGGVARHSLELDAGGFYRGFGLRLNGTYSAATHVRSTGLPGSSELRFGALTKLNARLFLDLGQQKKLTESVSFFKGSRLSLLAVNLLDSRQKVTDQTGAVPLAYQPDFLDPQGRVLGVEFRKLF